MRFALGCGCAAAAQPLILKPASAVVLSPLMPEPKTTWSDSGFANEMASGMSDYERFLSPLKAALFADVAGSVLELGLGTGPSLRYYGAARNVVGVEPNLAMHPLALASADAAGLGNRFSLVTGNAEQLPFEDASFDTVVGASCLRARMRGAASCAQRARADVFARYLCTAETMVLCSVRDVAASLREARRVLRPGGKLLFIEHVAAPAGTPLRAMQVWRVLSSQSAYACGRS